MDQAARSMRSDGWPFGVLPDSNGDQGQAEQASRGDPTQGPDALPRGLAPRAPARGSLRRERSVCATRG